jgi:hypothetical protein
VKQAVTSWLQPLENNFFCAGTKALTPQAEKCLGFSDDYEEV